MSGKFTAATVTTLCSRFGTLHLFEVSLDNMRIVWYTGQNAAILSRCHENEEDMSDAEDNTSGLVSTAEIREACKLSLSRAAINFAKKTGRIKSTRIGRSDFYNWDDVIDLWGHLIEPEIYANKNEWKGYVTMEKAQRISGVLYSEIRRQVKLKRIKTAKFFGKLWVNEQDLRAIWQRGARSPLDGRLWVNRGRLRLIPRPEQNERKSLRRSQRTSTETPV